VSSGFSSKFLTLSISAKILEIGSDSTKLQRVKRRNLFLRHSVESFIHYIVCKNLVNMIQRKTEIFTKC